MRGKRMVWGGRAPVRAVLYMAALVGRQAQSGAAASSTSACAPPGKPFKVAATACMRKLLTILNAMLQHNRRWDPQHA